MGRSSLMKMNAHSPSSSNLSTFMDGRIVGASSSAEPGLGLSPDASESALMGSWTHNDILSTLSVGGNIDEGCQAAPGLTFLKGEAGLFPLKLSGEGMSILNFMELLGRQAGPHPCWMSASTVRDKEEDLLPSIPASNLGLVTWCSQAPILAAAWLLQGSWESWGFVTCSSPIRCVKAKDNWSV